MLTSLEGGKPENSEKNPRCKARVNNKLNLHTTSSHISESENFRNDNNG